MDIVKKAQELKEIDDIKSEYDEIEKLLKDQKWDDLSIRLRELEEKYRIETAIYNFSHPIPAPDVQQNAVNCMDFLKTLEAAKAAHSAIESEQNRK